MASNNEIIAGLDLGTTKISAIVAERTDDGLDIIGIGSVPARGLKKGVVVNIESTVRAICSAVEQAETMAGCEVRRVYVGVSGSHVQGLNKEGVAAIANREVSQSDVERVLDQAKAIPLPGDRQVIHVLPQEYIIDDQDGVREPVGMSGVRLEARVHLVTVATSSVQNTVKCVERCGLEVAQVVFEPLASASAILSDDEKEIGVALVDVGGGTSDIAIFVDGAVVHSCVVPIGGINLTNDVATGLRTPVAEAERIKVRYGCASSAMVGGDEMIEVPSVGGRAPRVIPRHELCSIIEPRVDEIFASVKYVLDESGYANALSAGVVLCGGSAVLDGITDAAERLLGLPVRRGTPSGVGGLVDVVKSPAYATGVGLVKWACTQAVPVSEELAYERASRARWGARFGGWLREVF